MTNVAAISRDDALANVGRSLGLPESSASLDASSHALIAQSVRRAVFITAPCTYRTARIFVASALAPLSEDATALEDRIGDVIEELIATGDLLEMRREDSDGADIVLRPAPPAFVKRTDGSFILLGVAGDDITPVDNQLVSYRPSGLRVHTPEDSEVCHRALTDLGLIELPQDIWLHAPAADSAGNFLNGWMAKLPRMKKPEKIEELEVLDPAAPVGFYKGRWKPLTDKHAGVFLARRKQRYGARLWCLADVSSGLVQRLVDVHAKDARIRDCDEAWRILAASDAVAGTPQKIVVAQSGVTTLAFNSPLPAWAVRRLSLIGERISPGRALLAFQIPTQDLEEEVRWLEQLLWLARDTGGDA